MIYRISSKNNSIVVTAGKNEPRYKNESHFLHHLKLSLIKNGFDVIKKRMWKDGHLVDETTQIIRSRKYKSSGDNFAVYNSNSAIYDAGKRFNQDGEITLAFVDDYLKSFPLKEEVGNGS